MRLEVVTIGDELLLGFTVDTNAAFLARTLSEIGAEIVRRSTVGDEPDRIAQAVREALDRTGAVITTGGLGPTADDRTRPAIAQLFGRALRMDDAVMARIAARFQRYGYASMPASNSVQAMVPEGATVLDNPNGSAPGLWIEDESGRWVAMLPGVPHEMRAMTTDVIVPILTKRYAINGAVVLSRTLRTTGIGESALAELLGEDGHDTVAGLPLAFLPGWEGVDLRITAHDLPRPQAALALERAEAKLRSHADRYVYGLDGANLAAVVLDLCRTRAWHIGTAESCTGGMLGERITAISGSSDVYVGGVVAYSDRVKTSELGVPAPLIREHGAVSEAVARAMATGIRLVLGTEIGIGITGIAGPTGGTPEKPVGTVWIATDVNGDVHATGRRYLGDREDVRRRSAQAALDQVRRSVSGVG
jgi:nicotinamide-nucleotide amidase